MSLAIIYSRASSGISAPLVTVETHISGGMAGLAIVGLPEAAVKESKDRVRSAILNTHFEFPYSRITVNLAPADLPKEGGRFDLPIALGVLAASKQLPMNVLDEYEFTGELALSGELRPVKGVLPVVLGAHQAGRTLIIPAQNAQEAGLVRSANVLTAKHLLEVCAHLEGKASLPACTSSFSPETERPLLDLMDVKGQTHAKRALEIAAAGGHSLLLLGPPGTGKTMLAGRLPGILPDLDEAQALEVAAVASVSHHGFEPKKWKQIPFRSPHHSSSSAALVGGGRPPRPGEISLAHHGVLFLDELPEFNRHVIESLREPLESGCVTISRAACQSVFPARFQLVAAMNPCPCGYAGSHKECQCSPEQVKRYIGKLSGPFLDRLDMHVEVAHFAPTLLSETKVEEASADVRSRVLAARAAQLTRQGTTNAMLVGARLTDACILLPEAISLLNKTMTKFNFSARVYHRIMKVARTIADLSGKDKIGAEDVAEALSFRCLDRVKPY